MSRKPSLAGRAYLVVEDEYLVALHLCTELEEVGARVVGPTSSIDDALGLIEEGAHVLDGVVLDINLRGTMSYALADRLLERGLPFVFLTGYDCRAVPDRFRSVPCFTKPCRDGDLLALLAALPSAGPGDGKRTG